MKVCANNGMEVTSCDEECMAMFRISHENPDHENSIKLIEVFEWNLGWTKMTGMVMPLAEGGDLFSYIKKQGEEGLRLEEVGLVIRQLVCALQACHKANVAHRDVKLENILLMKENSVEHIVLTDFGLCSLDADVESKSFCGSQSYAAPELLAQEGKYRAASCGLMGSWGSVVHRHERKISILGSLKCV